MSDWTSGYVTELEYTYGYYRVLCPALLRLAVLSRRIAVRAGRPFRYLELGYGQGVSFGIHAAACPGEFWGTDFNPDQAAHAREMVDASGSGARALDASFAELAARPDLPEFDVIALHGVWSWVSDENCAVIVDLVRRKLAVGGMLFISYNCMPGWAPHVPTRHLMALHSELVGSDEKGIAARIDAAMGFVQQVVDAGSTYFRANPAAVERLKSISGMNRNYLAHEYFNRDWRLAPFSEVAATLAGAKVGFAASANLFDNIEHISFTAEGRKLMAEIAHPILRETVRDYLTGSQFRQDIYIKGGRRMSPVESNERFRAQGFVLVNPPGDIGPTLQTPFGEASLKGDLYRPLIDALAENNFAPQTLSELEAHPALRSATLQQLIEALTILVGADQVQPTQDADAVTLAAPRCAALNTYICGRARAGGEIQCLASPLTGGGVPTARFHQLFLLARQQGRQQPRDWVAFAWEALCLQGQRILKDGKALETDEDNIAELTSQAAEFVEKRLPILKALGVA